MSHSTWSRVSSRFEPPRTRPCRITAVCPTQPGVVFQVGLNPPQNPALSYHYSTSHSTWSRVSSRFEPPRTRPCRITAVRPTQPGVVFQVGLNPPQNPALSYHCSMSHSTWSRVSSRFEPPRTRPCRITAVCPTQPGVVFQVGLNPPEPGPVVSLQYIPLNLESCFK